MNDFKKFVRLTGMTKKRFGEITGVTQNTIDRYIDNPTLLRLKHLQLLANSEECKEQEVGDVELLNMIRDVK
jgi:hypothetical protein